MFTPKTIKFLQDLKANNSREWFHDNKQRYEDEVRSPALAFISEMESWIKMISPYYEANAKKIGGSLMRIHRDVRFAKDKSPYKTHIGIQFRHEVGKDVHAPGFYLHIEPDNIFIGVGAWSPAKDELGKIRDLIVAQPQAYLDAINHPPFTEHFELVGEKLTRAPKGYDKEHPEIEEIKRKDFLAISTIEEELIFNQALCQKIASLYGRSQPLMNFLCKALNLKF